MARTKTSLAVCKAQFFCFESVKIYFQEANKNKKTIE